MAVKPASSTARVAKEIAAVLYTALTRPGQCHGMMLPALSRHALRRFIRTGAPAVVGTLILLAGLTCLALAPATAERLRFAVFDAFQRMTPRAPASRPVVVVDVDDESLARIGQWPWSRRTVADLVDAVTDLGAGAMAFDVVFSEPDRTSPSRLVPSWERNLVLRRANPDQPLPDYDADLARAFARGRVVTGFGLVSAAGGHLPDGLASVATIGGDPRPRLTNFAGTVANLPVLDAAAAGHGVFTVPNPGDQVIRRVPLLMRVGDRILPALSLELLRVMQDEDTIKVRTERWQGQDSGYTVRVGDLDLPLDAAGYYWVHHAAPRSVPTVPAWRLLDPGARAELGEALKGKAVLVGTSAAGLVDLRATPLSAFEPGVDILAGIVEQITDGRHLFRPVWGQPAERLAALLAGGLVVALVSAGWIRTAWASGLLAASASWLAAVHLFRKDGLLLDPTPAMSLTLVALVAATLARFALADRSARRLRKAFAHYLSPDLVEVLASRPEALKLGGESREMTFLFTDLEGFTSLTEREGAEALVTLLNAYLDNLCRIAMDHGGTVDKIVGDAMHVMFNAPLDQPDHAERAVACAVALDRFAVAFAADHADRGLAFGTTRIGINTGIAVVGNFGGSRRFDYTAHGDAINTAARLEAANKALGTRICVARSTATQTHGHEFREVGTLMLKGKSVGVEVCTPVTGDPDAPAVERYNAAFARFAQGVDALGAELVRLQDEHPGDALLRLHATRIAAGERGVRIAA